MSFASETKTELCRTGLNKACCVRAELYGILLFCNSFTSSGVRILTEHRGFLQRTEKLTELLRSAGCPADCVHRELR